MIISTFRLVKQSDGEMAAGAAILSLMQVNFPETCLHLFANSGRQLKSGQTTEVVQRFAIAVQHLQVLCNGQETIDEMERPAHKDAASMQQGDERSVQTIRASDYSGAIQPGKSGEYRAISWALWRIRSFTSLSALDRVPFSPQASYSYFRRQSPAGIR